MDDQTLITKINTYLRESAKALSKWLGRRLAKVNDTWWDDCVIANLTESQKDIAQKKNITKLEDFDLAALLRITYKSWYAMRTSFYLPTQERECVFKMVKVRNNWAHLSVQLPGKDTIINDLKVLIEFLGQINAEEHIGNEVQNLLEEVEISEEETLLFKVPIVNEPVPDEKKVAVTANPIVVGSHVSINTLPGKLGIVDSISIVGKHTVYKVLVDNKIRPFMENQIELLGQTSDIKWVDANTFTSHITAYQINNPSANNLYSLNSARIDFVPYQFRPALKLIHADEPRILIADSVGVGKTIEAGLIIKELEARSELERVVVICPRPLVAERKWELEMRRFDEEFVSMTGQSLREAISDTDRDGEWPARFNKIIVPYSILDSKTYTGEDTKRGKGYGLKDLDPEPHFDLVIVDEAHHIRNGSMEKEKAFAYKCTKYFCDRADAVVMLTATPLQTSDRDLFTIMNVLRPDVVIDENTFAVMSRPNEYITKCSRIVRSNKENWQAEALTTLKDVRKTQWGDSVISENPLYKSVLERLQAADITREERVQLISDIESLHSFNTMFNRTRRRDIQDFCVRKSHTIEVEFTTAQSELHEELLRFEQNALSLLHFPRTVPFMISTLRRQAASCIFGIAPYIKDIVERRFSQLTDDPEIELDKFDVGGISIDALKRISARLIYLAENLPNEDSKFDKTLEVIRKKQAEENNKIMMFSTFKHTLAYIKRKLLREGLRVEQIDGSVKDETRYAFKERFSLPKDDANALDILLFTEVGSEGLDYQFCNMMINYDLPWNPMRIEQRIGRIDRRGQLSESVNIYNVITKDTVDAEIYHRCLSRIGVFAKSIGDCETILGEIASQIEEIAVDTKLTKEQREEKLQQIADNEVRKVQEINTLENEEKELFGFDLSEFTTSEELKKAENPWLKPANIKNLITAYLKERIGKNSSLLGDGPLYTLRLSVEARTALLGDVRALPGKMNAMRKEWENYLNGRKPNHYITFDSETAEKNRNSFFITTVHPLAKQAAKYFETNQVFNIKLNHFTNDLPAGTYAFCIYSWKYTGLREFTKLVTVCENEQVGAELFDILQCANSTETVLGDYSLDWSKLEEKHIEKFFIEQSKYKEDVQQISNYKLESLANNHNNLIRSLEQKASDASDLSIRNMYVGQEEKAEVSYNGKVAKIQQTTKEADILMEPLANGIIRIVGE
ncbi:MAG: helicase-related protein [Phascolarctobacterium sp.]|nr:helicase-related protein [Phascolarctobacterium sp.]